jgi:hypothetical protein
MHWCDSDRLLRMTDGDLHAYFFNLGDRIKRHIMAQDPVITRRWHFPDSMAPWEFGEWFRRASRLSPRRDGERCRWGYLNREPVEASEYSLAVDYL